LTFGELIVDARRKVGLSQKELAARVLKDDGSAISASYLNDIEHDRRSPSSESMIKQLAKALGLAPELLFFSAGRLPSEITRGADQKRVVKAFAAFRKALKGK
jgi:transcriptional regulator with XRE-family HTH domain